MWWLKTLGARSSHMDTGMQCLLLAQACLLWHFGRFAMLTVSPDHDLREQTAPGRCWLRTIFETFNSCWSCSF